MKEDYLGYVYPLIDDNKCVDCGMCANLCAFNQEKKLNMPKETYAAARSDEQKLINSSSGGIFAAIAENLLSMSTNWKIVGCQLDNSFQAKQIMIDSIDKVKELYGSKYVQSEMGAIYEEIKDELSYGQKVLFSGTPCQVAAIKQFVNNHENLYTIELICHGVPNQKMFSSYINSISKGITLFCFRDKEQGWSYNNSYKIGNKGKKINHRLSSYMTFFLNGDICRESCYSCPYAKPERGADISIGDFWGIIRQRPDLKEFFTVDKGVSCVLVNSKKGQQLFQNAEIKKKIVNYDDIRDGNEPLNHATQFTEQRHEIMNIWSKNLEWKDVTCYWKKHNYKFIFFLWSIVPIKIQHIIRVLLKKR